MRITKIQIIVGFLIFGLFRNTSSQALVNVPPPNVAPEDTIFLQHESQFRTWEPGAFWRGTHFAAYGIGHNTELDATLLRVSSPLSDNIALMLGFRSAIPVLTKQFPEQEFKVTVGAMAPISLQGNGVGSWGYTHVSGRLPKLQTRLTAGVSAGTENFFGRDVVCFIGGYEQPLTKRINLVGDWYSGSHFLGFFIPGFSIAISKTSTMFFGYQIPNSSKSGKSGFVFELSKFF
jgi:hypothetical protein